MESLVKNQNILVMMHMALKKICHRLNSLQDFKYHWNSLKDFK